MSDQIYTYRRQQLKKVIQELHHNDYNEVANKIGRSPGTLRKYIAPSSDRRISANLARSIEKQLDLPDEYLDKGKAQKDMVYFVFLSLTRHSPDVVKWIYDNFRQVIECSTLYGEFDIFMKISVPNTYQLEVLYNQLMRHPKIVKTKTFPTVNNTRFQREQSTFMNLGDQGQPESFIEKQKEKRINSLLWEIDNIEKKDRMILNESKGNVIHPVEIMESVHKKFWATRYYGERIRAQGRYLMKEKSRIYNDNIESKRIFLIKNGFEVSEDLNTFNKMITDAKKIADIGCKVHFLQEGNWIQSDNVQRKSKSFAIVDHSYIYTREQGQKDARLDYNEAYIDRCINLFETNWDISQPFEKFEPINDITRSDFFRILNDID